MTAYNVHCGTLVLERRAISNAAVRLTTELDNSYSARTERSIAFFVAQLLGSAPSMRYACENLPAIDTALRIPEETFGEIVQKVHRFKTAPDSLDAVNDLRQAISLLILED